MMRRGPRVLSDCPTIRLQTVNMPRWFTHRNWPEDPDLRPDAELAADLDVTAVIVDDLRCDGQAQARAVTTLLGREEWIEDVISVLGADPAAVVRDLDPDGGAGRGRRVDGRRRDADTAAGDA